MPSIVFAFLPPDAADTQETVECQFTPELEGLAAELENDPVKIYNWVYENIEYEDGYDYSRLGAYGTYLTKRGNSWDISSLIITLFRISNIPARYVKMTFLDGSGSVVYCGTYAIAWVSLVNYRGIDDGGDKGKGWVPLAPWYKRIRYGQGIDLFPVTLIETQDQNVWATPSGWKIPIDVNFDFKGYLGFNSDWSVKAGEVDYQKNALERYEEQIQTYLNSNHPGKTLADVGYEENMEKRLSSILPGNLPFSFNYNLNKEDLQVIGNDDRAHITFSIYRQSDTGYTNPLVQQIFYLPEIAGKRLCLDFIPATQNDADLITWYGGISGIQAAFSGGDISAVAQLKPVLMVDGDIQDTEGQPISSNESFVPGCNWPDHNNNAFCPRPSRKAGTFMTLAFDPLAASEKTVTKLKQALETVSSLQASDSGALPGSMREAFLGPAGAILAETYLMRHREAVMKSTGFLHGRINWSFSPTMIYVSPDSFSSDSESKFLVHPRWSIDTQSFGNFFKAELAEYNDGNTGWPIKIMDYKKICWDDPLNRFFRDLVMYPSSYNEARIFEDWQDTPSLSTVKGLMLAREQGIQVVELTDVNQLSSIANFYHKNTGSDRTGAEMAAIDAVISELQGGATVITPVQTVFCNGIDRYLFISNGPDYDAYNFGGDNGGGAGDNLYYIDNYTDLLGNEYFYDSNYGAEPVEIVSSEGIFYNDMEILDLHENMLNIHGIEDCTNIAKIDIVNQNVEALQSPWGDPVDLVTGEFYQDEQPDIQIKSRGFDLSVKRKYMSKLIYNGPFGYGWAWNHADTLILLVNGDVVYLDEDLAPHYCTVAIDGSYTYPAGTTFRLVKNVDSTFEIAFKSMIKYRFSADGLLVKKEDPYGNSLSFEYHNAAHPDRLSAIKDSLNRTLTFAYNPRGKIECVTDFTGRSCYYYYNVDAYGNGDDLRFFVDLEENTTEYQYLMNQENTSNNHNMIKYILPKGDFLEIGYYKNDTVAYHTNAKGNTFNFQYSRFNRYAETWNEKGYYRKIFWNGSHDVIRVTNENGTIECSDYDVNHNVISHTDANGNTTVFTYDAHRNMTSKTNALGEAWTYVYDAAINKPTSITDPKGITTSLAYNDKGSPTIITDALGNITTLSYDSYGNNYNIDYGYEYTSIYKAFNSSGNIYFYRDKNGKVTYFSYDEYGNLISKKDPAGYMTNYEYNNYNQKTAVIDALGNETIFDYDANRKLIRTVTADGAVTENIYDTARDIVSGAEVIEKIDSLGSSEYFDYDEAGNMIRKKDKNGNVFRYFYDGMNRLVEEMDPYQNSILYSYDGNGNLEAKEDKRGNRTSYTYDAANRKTSITDAEGATTSYLYDANGNLTDEIRTLKDASSDIPVVTHYEYDNLNRPVAKTLDYGVTGARTYQYRYDPLGRLVEFIEPKGNYTVNQYDKNGNKTKVEMYGSDGIKMAEKSYEYDSRNLLKKRKDAEGREWLFEYDALGRKIFECDPAGNCSSYAYDWVGNLVMETDQEGGVTKHFYDLAKRRIKTIDALEQTTVYTYDANGNLKSVIDPGGSETRTYYDALNRPVGVEDAAGDVTTYDYDEAGNIVQETRPDESTITKWYDDMNRLTDVYANNQEARHFEYDSLSRMIVADDYNEGNATHSVLFEYNAFNEVTAEVQDGKRVEKFYDANGNPEDLVYPDTGGFVVHRTYNGLNLPDSIKDQSQNSIAGFTYNLNGRVAAMTLGNGIEKSLSYNDRGMEGNRIYADIDTTTLYSMETTYDGMGNILSEAIERAISTIPFIGIEQYEKQYEYDDLNRLIIEQQGTMDTIQWQHDPEGNWTYTNQNGNQESRTANAVNEYTSITAATPTYDDRGNMTRDASKRYEYDWANRLIKVNTLYGSTIATYTYDALNRRVTKSYGGHTTAYIYNGGQVIEEYEDGQFRQSFVYGIYIDDPIMMEDNAGNRYYYLKDRQYSITALTDENGNIVETYEYTAFGLMTILDGQGGTIIESTVGNPYGYTGRRWDGESGLWYYRNRMYSAKLGRFMQRDPAGYADGLNLYAYVRNNPLRYLDPEGLTAVNEYQSLYWNDEYRESLTGNIALDAVADIAISIGQQISDAGLARARYETGVALLDPNDSLGRTALKQAIREQTPPLVRRPIEAIRPGLGPHPNSLGSANISNNIVNSVGGAFRIAGPVLLIAGVGYDAYQVYASPNPYRELAEVSIGLLGCVGGGIVGAIGGSFVTPVAGTAAGSVAGATAGGYLGRKLGIAIYDFINNP